LDLVNRIIAATTAARDGGKSWNEAFLAAQASGYTGSRGGLGGVSWATLLGATGPTYDTGQVNTGMDGYKYKCHVANAYGDTYSPPGTLIVTTNPPTTLVVNSWQGWAWRNDPWGTGYLDADFARPARALERIAAWSTTTACAPIVVRDGIITRFAAWNWSYPLCSIAIPAAGVQYTVPINNGSLFAFNGASAIFIKVTHASERAGGNDPSGTYCDSDPSRLKGSQFSISSLTLIRP
jgi:hypothetical protein